MPSDTRQSKHKSSGTGACTPSTDEDTLWEKISDRLLKSMNERFDHLENKFENLLTTQRDSTERLVKVEEYSSEQERRINALEQRLDELEKANKKLTAKVAELEGHSRRNNIKIIGIDEDEEKGRPTEFVAGLIPQIFGEENFAKPVTVDRAHRIPVPKPAPDKKPRSMVAKIHFYQEREQLLRLSRQKQLTYKGKRIYVYPDYSAEVMAQRREFAAITKELRERHVKYSLRYPAKLHVHLGDQVQIFTSPLNAKTFIDEMDKQSSDE